MAKIFNKFINSLKLDDEDGYDDEEEFEPDDELDLDYTDNRTYTNPRRSHDPSLDLYEDDDEEDYDDEEEDDSSFLKRTFKRKQQPTPVVPIHNKSNMEVCMVKPLSMNDAKEVTDILLSGKAVVINMEGVNVDLAQRLIDFTSGSCYAMNGNLQPISQYIFIVTPSNIGLSGDFEGPSNEDVLDIDI